MSWDFILRDEFVDDIKPSQRGWLWPAKDDGLWDGPKENWPQFKELIKRHCKKFETVVQAGGACGMYPMLLAQMFEVVYTFEPAAKSFHCLVHNTPQENIVRLNAAVGHMHEMVRVNYYDECNAGMNTVTADQRGIIPTLMIDDLDLPSCDFIMLDTEGYEYNAVLGAQQTISKFKPLIAMELGQTKAIEQFMESIGYGIIATAHADTYWAPKQ
jgi:FkbM family methyltransferase